MFDEGNTTYSFEHFIRVFTFSDLLNDSEDTITFDNQIFFGDDFIITFNN